MPSNKKIIDFSQRLGRELSDEVGNSEESEIKSMMSDFDKLLSDTIGSFNSLNFDKDGFIARLQDMDLGERSDKDTMKRILGNIRTDFADVNAVNNSDMMLRRDIFNICHQMPEMRDVIYTVRDAIIESDAVTGSVSRTINFGTESSEGEANKALVEDIETRYDLQLAIKNFIVPQTLMIGEMYVNVIPYRRLFAELDAIHSRRTGFRTTRDSDTKGSSVIAESNGNRSPYSLYSDSNMRYLKEAVLPDTQVDAETDYRIEKDSRVTNSKNVSDSYLRLLLENIDVCTDNMSTLMSELGPSGLERWLRDEHGTARLAGAREYFESVVQAQGTSSLQLDDDDIVDYKKFDHIKGCYIKYLDPLKVVPIRLDRKVIGYYYVTTSMDLQVNPKQPNGVVDLSFQHYAKDRNLVANLADLIIRSFDRSMLDKNIALKSEIAEIIMEHKFNEGRLSFLYIPENEVIRFVVNEDENGKGHSVIEPSLFPARMYLLLTLYNMLYTLNNNTTRVHYLRSSGLNKDYAAQIQRAIRKFQLRRITVDDIYSSSGVLNKIGGMGEMVLPSGRGDYKALETDTIAAVDNPVNTEFLEQMRRQAISGTGVPALLVINALDEVDFAKTLEMANTRFLSAVSSYKIDFNKNCTRMYQLILRYTSDLETSEIATFRYAFNSVRQSMLDITNNMVSNFNTLYETVSQIYFSKEELEDDNGKPSENSLALKRELAEEFMPHLNYDDLDRMIDRVRMKANERILQKRVQQQKLDKEDIDSLENEEKSQAS